MTDFRLEPVPATTVATLRRTLPVGELTEFFGTSFALVAEAVADAGGHVSVPPFAWYHSMPTDTVDVLGRLRRGRRRAHPRRRRGAARATRAGGPSSGSTRAPTTPSRRAGRPSMAWTAAERLTPRAEFWEEYLTEPEGDPSHGGPASSPSSTDPGSPAWSRLGRGSLLEGVTGRDRVTSTRAPAPSS